MDDLKTAMDLTKTVIKLVKNAKFSNPKDDNCRIDSRHGHAVRSELNAITTAKCMAVESLSALEAGYAELKTAFKKPGVPKIHSAFKTLSVFNLVDEATIGIGGKELFNSGIMEVVEDVEDFVDRYRQESVMIAVLFKAQSTMFKLKKHINKLERARKRNLANKEEESHDDLFKKKDDEKEPEKKKSRFGWFN